MGNNVQRKAGHGFLMFVLGSTAGAVVALLSAPGSGMDTRRRLKGTLKQVGSKVSSVSETVADSVSRGTLAIKNGVMQAFDKDALKSPLHAGHSYNSGSRR